MGKKKQILIAGGGTAASVAAAAAIEAGAEVTLAFPNGGASELSAGAVDVAGVLPQARPELVGRYEEGARELARRYPGHPYAQTVEVLQLGLDALSSLSAEGGYFLAGFGGSNVWLPNVAGTFTPNAYVSALQLDSVANPAKPERVLVAGFAGDAAFDAQAAAASYAHHQRRIGVRDEWFSTVLQLDGLSGRHRVSAGELADYLDTERGARDLADKLSGAVEAGKYRFDKVVLAPVLGFSECVRALRLAREAAGVPVGEVQAIANSVTGYRFTRAIWAGLQARGARIVRPARVTSLREEGGRVVADVTAGLQDALHPGRRTEIEADAVVLATGGFLGGGLRSDADGTNVAVLGTRLGHVAEADVSRNAVDPAGQAYLRGGLQVEPGLRVPGFERVFAAGDVLAGHGGAIERSSAGVAAATGYFAGYAAAIAAAGAAGGASTGTGGPRALIRDDSEREW